jgi:hypothetical protein
MKRAMFYISRVALMALLSLFVALAVVPLRSQKKDPCAPFLEKAKRHVQKSRDSFWVGVDGLRLVAIEEVTDYLVCKESQ